jgi:hypothetical protein
VVPHPGLPIGRPRALRRFETAQCERAAYCRRESPPWQWNNSSCHPLPDFQGGHVMTLYPIKCLGLLILPNSWYNVGLSLKV